MNIDSHMHVNFKGLDASGIVSYLDREGLGKCWLLTWEEVSPKAPVYLHLSADEMFDAYRKYPERICPMYAPDPQASRTRRISSWPGWTKAYAAAES